MADLEKAIVSNLGAFIGFAQKRVGDAALAADLVQDSLVKALQAANMPADDEKMVPWFYQILRRSIIDLYRRNDARNRALSEFEASLPQTPDSETTSAICNCFKDLIPHLPEQYQQILQEVDVKGRATVDVARDMGVTPNNLNVRLFRARKQLRDRLETVCQSCSVHGCLDCTCGD